MTTFPYKTALIVGAGPGISASLARRLSALGVGVGLAARDVEKLKGLADETGAKTFAVDATDPSAVATLFFDAERLLAEPDVVIYNAGARVTGRLADLDPAAVEKCVAINAVGAFLVAQQAAKRMEPRGHGAIVFTGATAGVKGFAKSALLRWVSSRYEALPKAQQGNWVRKAFTWPISTLMEVCVPPTARIVPTTRTAHWTRMPLHKRTLTCCHNQEALGRSMSICARGRSRSKGRCECCL